MKLDLSQVDFSKITLPSAKPSKPPDPQTKDEWLTYCYNITERMPGVCFLNAMMLTLNSRGRFVYHQGTVICHKGRVAHAWNTFDGEIVDQAWRGSPSYESRATFSYAEIKKHVDAEIAAKNGIGWIQKPTPDYGLLNDND